VNVDDLQRLSRMFGSPELGDRTEQVFKLQVELTFLRDLARATDRWFEAIPSTATIEEADMAMALLAYRRFMDNGSKESDQ
jgi:hypothetical protein